MILDCSKYVGPCRCGREHTLETKKVVVEYNALDKFDQYMDEVGLSGAPSFTIRTPTTSRRSGTCAPTRRSSSTPRACTPKRA